MKKAILTLSIMMACSCAWADGNAFTPLNFEDASPVITSASTTTSTPANTVVENTTQTDQTGNVKMQNAITQLDNAQVEVRNELLNIKTKYSDVDAKYQALKTERQNLGKQMRSMERRINKIEKQKENIRKNML